MPSINQVEVFGVTYDIEGSGGGGYTTVSSLDGSIEVKEQDGNYDLSIKKTLEGINNKFDSVNSSIDDINDFIDEIEEELDDVATTANKADSNASAAIAATNAMTEWKNKVVPSNASETNKLATMADVGGGGGGSSTIFSVDGEKLLIQNNVRVEQELLIV